MTDKPSYKFPQSMRIRRKRDFDAIFASGSRMTAGGLTIITKKNLHSHPRLGISVPKSYGSAVARNRIKRRIREAFRLTQHALARVDILCIPRRGLEVSVEQLKKILIRAAGQNDR